MNITKLLGNRVLIQLDPPLQLPDHLFIPEALRPRPNSGLVLILGQDRKGCGCGMLADLAVGDHVTLDRTMGGVDLIHNGKPCRLVNIMDVECVIS